MMRCSTVVSPQHSRVPDAGAADGLFPEQFSWRSGGLGPPAELADAPQPTSVVCAVRDLAGGCEEVSVQPSYAELGAEQV
jgi:hypothetical protein